VADSNERKQNYAPSSSAIKQKIRATSAHRTKSAKTKNKNSTAKNIDKQRFNSNYPTPNSML
jgi:hypothetical protein